MELIECNNEEYNAVFSKPYHVFNSAAFNHLNAHKCEEVKYLLFKDTKYRLGLIAGIRNKQLISPFSAPFGGFSFVNEDIRVSMIEEAVDAMEHYIKLNSYKGVKLILPPLFYNETFLAKLINVLYRKQYSVMNLDLDFYLRLNGEAARANKMWHNAKKNLSISFTKDLALTQCNDKNGINEVYEVIRSNRSNRGFPMTMELEDIVSTANIIGADFFIVKTKNEAVAAAIAYHVNESTIYIPYWGDKNGYGDMKPMNFMADHLFEHYKNKQKAIVHIGIATENSQPNYGLIEFKESIGCDVTPKFTYFKQF